MFMLRIFKRNRRNVPYPISVDDSDDDDVVEGDVAVTLTKYQASRSQFNLSKEIGLQVRASGVKYWKLRGPCEEEVECKILSNTKYVTKLGQGWKWFCMVNQLKAGDMCAFELAEGVPNTLIVHVTRS